MKDYAVQLALAQPEENSKRNALREYLQAYLLRILHDQGFFRFSVFLGGTALRFLYGLPRFSEDLDFSLEKREGYAFEEFLQKTRKELEKSGYRLTVAYKNEKTVQYALFKFEDLLYETGLSPLPAQKLSIKVKVDTRPPAGGAVQSHTLQKYFPLALSAYDIPSLFAGKLTAVFCRKYTKGRDYFDLGWYLARSRDLAPNIPLLQNALKQMSWQGDLPEKGSWRAFTRRYVEKADWKQVTADVKNLLENPSDLKIFSKDNILRLLT